MAQQLIVLKADKARALLALARTPTDAKAVVDIAHAAKIAAIRQGALDAAAECHDLKIDALAVMGAMLREGPKHKGNRAKGTGSNQHKKQAQSQKSTAPPTQEQLFGKGGRKVAAEAQAVARVQERKPQLFKALKAGKVTVAQATKAVRDQVKRDDLKRKASAAKRKAAARASENDTQEDEMIICGDCRATLGIREKARLIFADPPYNIGVDYGGGEKADLLDHDDFVQFCSEWIAMCHARLADDGSLWVLIGDEYAAQIGCLLWEHEFTLRNWIKWYETFGVNCEDKFNRCSRHLFYCVKDPDRFVFHASAVRRPSDRQAKYNDPRAALGGKVWDDVWQIPRLMGTSTERIPDFPTQLPLELLAPIIRCASDPGDLVIDPFCGSGTTGEAALRAGRRFIGIEKSERFADLARARLAVVQGDA